MDSDFLVEQVGFSRIHRKLKTSCRGVNSKQGLYIFRHGSRVHLLCKKMQFLLGVCIFSGFQREEWRPKGGPFCSTQLVDLHGRFKLVGSLLDHVHFQGASSTMRVNQESNPHHTVDEILQGFLGRISSIHSISEAA